MGTVAVDRFGYFVVDIMPAFHHHDATQKITHERVELSAFLEILMKFSRTLTANPRSRHESPLSTDAYTVLEEAICFGLRGGWKAYPEQSLLPDPSLCAAMENI